MRSSSNHLDALKSRTNRKHLPHWLIDWWINKLKKEVEGEYSISNSTWVSMPKRVYWGTSRRRRISNYYSSFLFWKFCGFSFLFGVWETSRRLSRARDAHRENRKINISFLPFLLVHLQGKRRLVYIFKEQFLVFK